ncbi:hypothetical protein [Chondromyces apiculatus]|uniref:SGNH hydrolase-type esterase domain-containing protein n=1 Tax=Chondromyces apiculatus DSM 436 TaxID=1192034 RepID=A0A017SXF7_9BACT|nr:hypothetical protein [Chondromyces apiculatus]EYF01659.1 Hypothetical protein CAP_7864 [Chondromyces apiculatus DSM 436]
MGEASTQVRTEAPKTGPLQPTPRRTPRLLRAAAWLSLLGILGTHPATAQDAEPSKDIAASLSAQVANAEPEPLPLAEPRGSEESAATDAEARPRKTSSRATPAKQRRGGINPCMTPDPGWGVHDHWSRAPSMGQMISPHKGGITKSGAFDVIIHFHGHEAVRKEFVKTPTGMVLVGIDLGIGSGAYANAFASPGTFERLLASIEAGMASKTGKKNAHIRKLALSAWSAGYGAIEQILRQPSGKKVDALVLLDSLHAGYADEQTKALKSLQIEPFVEFARSAAKGKKFMFLSHSSIIPPGYASTTEVAEFLVKRISGKLKKSKREDVLGLDMIQRFDRNDLHVRGYTGDDKPDHCAHIGLMADIVRVHLQPRWKTPKGRL